MDEPIKGKGEKGELLPFVVITLLIVLPIRIFIAQPFVVNGASMVPTFDDGDYLIVDELTYRLREPKRGEVLVFRYPKDPSKFFIKRIVGLPGETIEVESNTFIVEKSGTKVVLDDMYLRPNTVDYLHTTLESDEYFVMGDNRNASSDSRIWGPVNKSELIGRPIIRLLPIKSASFLPGDYKE